MRRLGGGIHRVEGGVRRLGGGDPQGGMRCEATGGGGGSTGGKEV